MPVINLDEIVPEDITFTFRGSQYTVPGDIDVDTTFTLVSLFDKAQQAETNGNVETLKETNQQMERVLISLFQQRDPAIQSLPFGVLGYRHVLLTVLAQIGFQIVNDEPELPPTPPTPAPKTSQRRRSSGSRK